MAKKKHLKALVMGAIALTLSCSMLVGTTFAWFTDSVTSSNNVIKSGNLDVELEYKNSETTSWTRVNSSTNVFQSDLWEPGHTEVVQLKVLNEGSLALKYQLGINIASEVGSVNVDGDPFKLSDYIMFGVAEGENAYSTREKAIEAVEATATTLKTAYNSTTTKLEAKNDTNTDESVVTVVVYMPETVDNEANHAKGEAVPTIHLGINLFATQVAAEDDSFGNDYDNGAYLPEVNTEAELVSALEQGSSVKLGSDIVLTETIEIPALATTFSLKRTAAPQTVLDLNGKKITSSITGNPAILNNGSLLITGDGSIENTISNSVKNRGNLVIEGGKYVAGSYGINNDGGVLTVKNALVESGGGIYTWGGSVTVDGGEFYSTASGKHVIYAGAAEVVLNGGCFHSEHGNNQILFANGGQVTVNGGKYSTDKGQNGAWTTTLVSTTSSAIVTINAGEFVGGGLLVNGGTLNVYGGSFNDIYSSNSMLYSGAAAIYGGTYIDENSKAFAKKYLAEEYKITENSDGSLTVNPYYAPIETAEALVEAIAEGGAYQIAQDITLEEAVEVAENTKVELDLGGNSIVASNGNYAIENQNGGELVITDTKASTASTYSRRAVTGGIVGVVYTGEGSTTTVNGGTFSAVEGEKYVFLNSSGTLIINGGTINGGSSYPIYSYNAGNSLTINDVTVNATFGCVNAYGLGGTVAINGGTFNMTGVQGNTSHIAYFSQNSVVTINGGSFNKVGDISMSATGGGGVCANGGAKLTINGGSFAGDHADVYNYGGEIAIKGGTFKFNPTTMLVAGYKAEQVDGVWAVSVAIKDATDLQNAINNAKDGETIVLAKSIESQDGILVTDKKITIDLNGNTFTVSEGASTNNRNFKINGASVVTIKNGTLVAQGELTSGAYGTVRTEDSAKVTLSNLKLYSYRGYGLNVKANTGTEIVINNTEIYSQYSGGVEAAGGKIELNGVKIEQTGVYSGATWCSVAIGVNGGGTVTVNSGSYSARTIATDANAAQGTWVAYVMSSGGNLIINGGTFNGVVAETASAANACGVICADRAAVVTINGGEFVSNGAILDMRNNVGSLPNPVATLAGGTFSADPRVSGLYNSNLITVAQGYTVVENADGTWTVVKAE